MLNVITRSAIAEQKSAFWQFAHHVGLESGKTVVVYPDRQAFNFRLLFEVYADNNRIVYIPETAVALEGATVVASHCNEDGKWETRRLDSFPFSLRTEEGVLNLCSILEAEGFLNE